MAKAAPVVGAQSRRVLVLAGGVVLGIAALFVLASVAEHVMYSGSVLPGVHIDGTQVSGKKDAAARASIDALERAARDHGHPRAGRRQDLRLRAERHRLHRRPRRDDSQRARRRAGSQPARNGDRHRAAPVPARSGTARRALRLGALRGPVRRMGERGPVGSRRRRFEVQRHDRRRGRAARGSRTAPRRCGSADASSPEQRDAPRPAAPAGRRRTERGPCRGRCGRGAGAGGAHRYVHGDRRPDAGHADCGPDRADARDPRSREQARPHDRGRPAPPRARPRVRRGRGGAPRRNLRSEQSRCGHRGAVAGRPPAERRRDRGRDPARQPHDHGDDPQRASRTRHQVGPGARYHAPGVVVHDLPPRGRSTRAQHPPRGRRARQHRSSRPARRSPSTKSSVRALRRRDT